MATINLDELIPAKFWKLGDYDSEFAKATFHLDNFAPFELVMDSGRGYDRRFSVGGWDHDGFGRKVSNGPIVEGPHGYMFGLATVISARPQEQKSKIRFTEGDRIQVRNEVYEISFAPRDRAKEWPVLTHVASVASRDN